jgi:wyosine [tRNA(Phe)-imidazoG37] synthetase (radical SAM superfamily)
MRIWKAFREHSGLTLCVTGLVLVVKYHLLRGMNFDSNMVLEIWKILSYYSPEEVKLNCAFINRGN